MIFTNLLKQKGVNPVEYIELFEGCKI